VTRHELDSLTVVRDRQGRIELVNSSGHVAYFRDRGAAYAKVRELRQAAKQNTRRARLAARRR
jgi:hypothetical protein